MNSINIKLVTNVGFSILRTSDRVRQDFNANFRGGDEHDFRMIWTRCGNELWDAYLLGCKVMNVEPEKEMIIEMARQ